MYSSALRMRSAQQTILMRDTMFFERERNWFAVETQGSAKQGLCFANEGTCLWKECILARYEFGALQTILMRDTNVFRARNEF